MATTVAFSKVPYFLLLSAMPMKGLRRNDDPERKKAGI
jgi:hypothetical protein